MECANTDKERKGSWAERTAMCQGKGPPKSIVHLEKPPVIQPASEAGYKAGPMERCGERGAEEVGTQIIKTPMCCAKESGFYLGNKGEASEKILILLIESLSDLFSQIGK